MRRRQINLIHKVPEDLSHNLVQITQQQSKNLSMYSSTTTTDTQSEYCAKYRLPKPRTTPARSAPPWLSSCWQPTGHPSPKLFKSVSHTSLWAHVHKHTLPKRLHLSGADTHTTAEWPAAPRGPGGRRACLSAHICWESSCHRPGMRSHTCTAPKLMGTLSPTPQPE